MKILSEAEPYGGRTVAVTGAFGFLGTNLVLALVAAGSKVRAMSHSWPAKFAGLNEMLERIDFVKSDLRDEAGVIEAVRDAEIIFNLAGKSGSMTSNTSPLDDLDVNARGQLTFLEACRRAAPNAKIVFPSSRLVYRPTTALPVPETAPTGSLSIYGIHKLAAEEYHLLYSRLYGLRSSILRITNPYGPFQRAEQNRYGIINWFIHLAINRHELPIYGDGSQLRDYVHVADVTRAFLLAGSHSEADGQVLNVGSGQAISLRGMAELVIRTAGGGSIQWLPWPEDATKVETGNFVADIGRIRRTLGWRPTIRLEDGVPGVVKHYTEGQLTHERHFA